MQAVRPKGVCVLGGGGVWEGKKRPGQNHQHQG